MLFPSELLVAFNRCKGMLNSNHAIRYSDKCKISLQSQELCAFGMSIYKQHSGINAEAALKYTVNPLSDLWDIVPRSIINLQESDILSDI